MDCFRSAGTSRLSRFATFSSHLLADRITFPIAKHNKKKEKGKTDREILDGLDDPASERPAG